MDSNEVRMHGDHLRFRGIRHGALDYGWRRIELAIRCTVMEGTSPTAVT